MGKMVNHQNLADEMNDLMDHLSDLEPDSKEYAGEVEMDPQGYIIAGEDGCTSAAGVYAAGDVRTKVLRQVITAAADGAVCVTSAERYLAEE